MLKFKTLWQGKYLSIVDPIDEEYEAVHEKDVIIVYPVIRMKQKTRSDGISASVGEFLVGIRQEHCPPYLIKDKLNEDLYYTVISGGIEEGETPDEAMKRELKEEAGVELIEYKVIEHKKYIPLCKTSDMRADIYIIVIDSFRAVPAEGDGTKNEELSKTTFVNLKSLKKIIEKPNVDNLLYSGYYLLVDKLKDLI